MHAQFALHCSVGAALTATILATWHQVGTKTVPCEYPIPIVPAKDRKWGQRAIEPITRPRYKKPVINVKYTRPLERKREIQMSIFANHFIMISCTAKYQLC